MSMGWEDENGTFGHEGSNAQGSDNQSTNQSNKDEVTTKEIIFFLIGMGLIIVFITYILIKYIF